MTNNGYTVNEMLYLNGKIEEFDTAVRIKNVSQVIKILKEIGLDRSSIESILKSYGL